MKFIQSFENRIIVFLVVFSTISLLLFAALSAFGVNVTAKWNSDYGASAYRVQFGTNIVTTTATNCVFTNIVAGQNYSVSVSSLSPYLTNLWGTETISYTYTNGMRQQVTGTNQLWLTIKLPPATSLKIQHVPSARNEFYRAAAWTNYIAFQSTLSLLPKIAWTNFNTAYGTNLMGYLTTVSPKQSATQVFVVTNWPTLTATLLFIPLATNWVAIQTNNPAAKALALPLLPEEIP